MSLVFPVLRIPQKLWWIPRAGPPGKSLCFGRLPAKKVTSLDPPLRQHQSHPQRAGRPGAGRGPGVRPTILQGKTSGIKNRRQLSVQVSLSTREPARRARTVWTRYRAEVSILLEPEVLTLL